MGIFISLVQAGAEQCVVLFYYDSVFPLTFKKPSLSKLHHPLTSASSSSSSLNYPQIESNDQESEAMNCIYKDPLAPIEARIKDLLSQMTLPEKIAQMTQIERSVATPSAIKDLSIGHFQPPSFLGSLKVSVFVMVFLLNLENLFACIGVVLI